MATRAYPSFYFTCPLAQRKFSREMFLSLAPLVSLTSKGKFRYGGLLSSFLRGDVGLLNQLQRPSVHGEPPTFPPYPPADVFSLPIEASRDRGLTQLVILAPVLSFSTPSSSRENEF